MAQRSRRLRPATRRRRGLTTRGWSSWPAVAIRVRSSQRRALGSRLTRCAEKSEPDPDFLDAVDEPFERVVRAEEVAHELLDRFLDLVRIDLALVAAEAAHAVQLDRGAGILVVGPDHQLAGDRADQRHARADGDAEVILLL